MNKKSFKCVYKNWNKIEYKKLKLKNNTKLVNN